jgi:Sodium/hydrogen exchanger family
MSSPQVLLSGMLVAELWHISNNTDSTFHSALGSWAGINPDVLATILLPLLIFASAFSSSVHVMQAECLQFLWLAVPMALIGALLAALYVQYVLPLGFDFSTALLLGAIVSATDPIAVVAILRELGVSEKLGTMIEGESLMNDGSAYVLFVVMLQSLQGEDRSPGEMVLYGLRLAFGGVALGVAMGIGACWALGRVVNDAMTTICIFLVVTYGAWLAVSARLACARVRLAVSSCQRWLVARRDDDRSARSPDTHGRSDGYDVGQLAHSSRFGLPPLSNAFFSPRTGDRWCVFECTRLHCAHRYTAISARGRLSPAPMLYIAAAGLSTGVQRRADSGLAG